MLIDGVAGMTISNGVLRVAVGRIDANGQTSTEDIFIPANCINNVVQALVQGVEDLNTKMAEENKGEEEGNSGDSKKKSKKSSLTDVDEKSD
tara:strand:+ start:4723 stop:4998 length:276 start_codon:yes stop_codon:yes gene_type:complete